VNVYNTHTHLRNIICSCLRQKATMSRKMPPIIHPNNSSKGPVQGFISPIIKQLLGHSFQLTSLICGTYEILCSCLRQKATMAGKFSLSLTTITAGFISPNIKQPLGHSFQLTSLICGTYEILCSCFKTESHNVTQNAPYHSPQ
jgi:hypothetical protein